MKNFYFLLLIVCSLYSFAQNDKTLKLTDNKENVVANAIEGRWKAKDSTLYNELKFTKEPTVLKSISAMYFEGFKNLKIYHAGYLKMNRKNENYIHPYFITELNGNPYLFYFRERNNNPIGDSESFILFIALDDTKSQDKLFVGGDFNNKAFHEYERVIEK